MLLKRHGETLFISILLIIGIIFGISAQSIETGAEMSQGGDFMPKLISTIWIITTTIILITHLAEKKNELLNNAQEKISNGSFKGFTKTFFLLFIYILFLDKIGFIIMSALYMFFQMILFTSKERKNYVLFLIISIMIPIAVYYLFANVFSLILPSGLLK